MNEQGELMKTNGWLSVSMTPPPRDGWVHVWHQGRIALAKYCPQFPVPGVHDWLLLPPGNSPHAPFPAYHPKWWRPQPDPPSGEEEGSGFGEDTYPEWTETTGEGVVRWRGSVSDLVTDLRALLSLDQVEELSVSLVYRATGERLEVVRAAKSRLAELESRLTEAAARAEASLKALDRGDGPMCRQHLHEALAQLSPETPPTAASSRQPTSEASPPVPESREWQAKLDANCLYGKRVSERPSDGERDPGFYWVQRAEEDPVVAEWHRYEIAPDQPPRPTLAWWNFPGEGIDDAPRGDNPVAVLSPRLLPEPEAGARSEPPLPVPMLLWCPECNERHVDRGEFATKPHHTHACQFCGHVWRPAIAPTTGVQFLPGFKNEPEPASSRSPALGRRAAEESPGETPAGSSNAETDLRELGDRLEKIRRRARSFRDGQLDQLDANEIFLLCGPNYCPGCLAQFPLVEGLLPIHCSRCGRIRDSFADRVAQERRAEGGEQKPVLGRYPASNVGQPGVPHHATDTEARSQAPSRFWCPATRGFCERPCVGSNCLLVAERSPLSSLMISWLTGNGCCPSCATNRPAVVGKDSWLCPCCDFIYRRPTDESRETGEKT